MCNGICFLLDWRPKQLYIGRKRKPVLKDRLQNVSHSEKACLKKGSAEPQRFCRTLGAKPSSSGPARSSPNIRHRFVSHCTSTLSRSFFRYTSQKALNGTGTHCFQQFLAAKKKTAERRKLLQTICTVKALPLSALQIRVRGCRNTPH